MQSGTGPGWLYWAVAIILTLLYAWGSFLFVELWTMSAAEKEALLEPVDLALTAAMPAWAELSYALGMGAGLIGAILMLLRRRGATWLFILSVIGFVLERLWLLTQDDVQVALTPMLALAPLQSLIGAAIVHKAKERGHLRG